MKNIRHIFLFGFVCSFAVGLWSCGKDKLHNTWHPDQAMITVITEWETTTGAIGSVPYVIMYGKDPDNMKDTVVNGAVNSLPLTESGIYDIEIFNEGKNYSVDGDIITIKDDEKNPGYIYSNPNFFFTARDRFSAVADKNNIVRIPMKQQMRNLIVRVYFKNDPKIYTWQNPNGTFREIASVGGQLTGIAGKLDFIGEEYSNPRPINLTFEPRYMNNNTVRYYESESVLLGVNGDEQELTFSFEFAYGDQLEPYVRDYHIELSGFNDEKYEPFIIEGEIRLPMVPDGSTEIADYEGIDEGDIDVGQDTYTYKVGELYPYNSEVKEGIVVWVASDNPDDPNSEGSHGMVMSLAQAHDVAWGPKAEIEGTGDPLGIKNTEAIRKYVFSNADGYSEDDYEAYQFAVNVTGVFSTSWFLPSRQELDFFSRPLLADIDNMLIAKGYDPIGNVRLWSSETEVVVKPVEEWEFPPKPLPGWSPDNPEGIPVYDLSLVFVWDNENKVIDKENAAYENPLWELPTPGVPEPQPGDDDYIPRYLPYYNDARAFRFF